MRFPSFLVSCTVLRRAQLAPGIGAATTTCRPNVLFNAIDAWQGSVISPPHFMLNEDRTLTTGKVFHGPAGDAAVKAGGRQIDLRLKPSRLPLFG